MLHFTTPQQPRIRVLSDDQVRELHFAALEILDRTGVEVRDARALKLLQRAGARGDADRVRIPPHLVDEALRTAPERVVVSAQTGERTMPLEEGRVFFGTGSDTPNTVDLETRQRRPALLQDVADIARLCDALPNIDFVMSMGVPSDVPADSSYVEAFAGMLKGSSKPIVFTACDAKDIEDIYEMAVAVAGDEGRLRANPFLVHYAEPISPLIHAPEGTGKLLFCAEHGIPVAYPSGTMAGASTPAALAGACALANAECLSGLVIHQLAAPGAPFIYGVNVSVMDMRSTSVVYGGPEWSLTSAAFADLARFYRLPAWGTAGASDSKVLDAQAGLEAMCSISTAILGRSNLVHDVGYIESGLTSSMEMVLICDEIIAMMGLIYGGMPMDADRLALDVIDAVGPGGSFLDTDHTLRYFRSDHFLPGLLDRNYFERWQQDGARDIVDRANARARDILASHQPVPLPDAAHTAIEKVLTRPRAARAED